MWAGQGEGAEREKKEGGRERRGERVMGRGETEMSRDTKRRRGKIQENYSQMERWVWGQGQTG